MQDDKRLIDAFKLVICMARRQRFGMIHYDDVLATIADCPTEDAFDLPCRMGDQVWGIKRHHKGNSVKCGTVNQMYYGEDMRLCICVKNVCRGEWGKNVFATKAEAQRRLDAEMRGG